MPKIVTMPVDALTVLYRATEFANVPEEQLEGGVPKRLHVLPPGAPYKMDQRGFVYASPRRKRDQGPGVKRCWDAMRQALLNATHGGRPGSDMDVTIKSTREDRMRRYPDGAGYRLDPTQVVEVSAPFESAFWWRSQSVERGDISEGDFVIPTLDGLVAAARAMLLSSKCRERIRRCPSCHRFFIRGPRRQATCGRDACKSKRIREQDAKRVARWRSG